ncbi:hypothetical protein ABIE37_000947 [Arthrobacter bambusae]|uniref:DUF6919 domain-containing protein n=1 Tax=Arthrobacter bambusae TaxID=1338426 RepID=A0ABV2P3D2_9MICC
MDADRWRAEGGPDAELWKRCYTWADACELAAQWLEGKIRFMPGNYDAQPDEESGPLLEALATINRWGLFTDQSQPGVAISDGCGQRAFITGFCSEDLAATIGSHLQGTDLVVITIPAFLEQSARVCVTIDGGEEFTWVGIAGASHEVAAQFREETNETLAIAMAECWQLHIFDPVWGRTELLWDTLVEAAGLDAGRKAVGKRCIN